VVVVCGEGAFDDQDEELWNLSVYCTPTNLSGLLTARSFSGVQRNAYMYVRPLVEWWWLLLVLTPSPPVSVASSATTFFFGGILVVVDGLVWESS
jgi:hypothetical protein